MKLGELVAKYPTVELEECPYCHGTAKRGGVGAGRALREMRIAAGISHRKMAHEMGISLGQLTHAEAGRRSVSIAFIEAWLTVCKQWART